MNYLNRDLKKYAPVILRLGLTFVFIWFGLNQILDQSAWVSLIPTGLTKISGVSAETFIVINGVFEVLMAILLAFGIQTRIVASLLFLHMIVIVSELGLTAVGVRDIGLMFALLSIAFQAKDEYSLR